MQTWSSVWRRSLRELISCPRDEARGPRGPDVAEIGAAAAPAKRPSKGVLMGSSRAASHQWRKNTEAGCRSAAQVQLTAQTLHS